LFSNESILVNPVSLSLVAEDHGRGEAVGPLAIESREVDRPRLCVSMGKEGTETEWDKGWEDERSLAGMTRGRWTDATDDAAEDWS
jgi:hypothetical protein